MFSKVGTLILMALAGFALATSSVAWAEGPGTLPDKYRFVKSIGPGVKQGIMGGPGTTPCEPPCGLSSVNVEMDRFRSSEAGSLQARISVISPPILKPSPMEGFNIVTNGVRDAEGDFTHEKAFTSTWVHDTRSYSNGSGSTLRHPGVPQRRRVPTLDEALPLSDQFISKIFMPPPAPPVPPPDVDQTEGESDTGVFPTSAIPTSPFDRLGAGGADRERNAAIIDTDVIDVENEDYSDLDDYVGKKVRIEGVLYDTGGNKGSRALVIRDSSNEPYLILLDEYGIPFGEGIPSILPLNGMSVTVTGVLGGGSAGYYIKYDSWKWTRLGDTSSSPFRQQKE